MSLSDGMYKLEEGFDESTSLQVLRKASELGITLFNTAAFYGNGANETLIGTQLIMHSLPCYADNLFCSVSLASLGMPSQTG